ncbi:hypothetical protein LOZ39_003249 [Ophidiomyces ophidiicola]|uniref:Uncharacterized protein n=1 Tax=Ophidiomyces ophidiicola TaxID=1387563 RepID=A0ACB8UVH3_9EURO|nr:hypothetical protein LOZ62_003584 [Ophidiomyces ophidiicola]KAI1955964.1 hypothetical protein LOZ59_004346 [Ophidiomyces ophidiicola]KAI1971431.1 hypothetical protein LOZ56_003000 [Ophidiomyces ophidiicola]KAI2005604.1 hypothetical protein LOZ50_003542 [Ophidiomyces ophidiicola]KAI2069862.1 hypothetical protein LOZ37_005174 [Ophidiomyces ophidiicola]
MIESGTYISSTRLKSGIDPIGTSLDLGVGGLLGSDVEASASGSDAAAMRTASTKRRANSSAQEIAGDAGVLLCVAGLGPSAILSNRESIRVYLPHRLKEILETTETSVLKGIARSYAKGRVKPGAPATQENQA